MARQGPDDHADRPNGISQAPLPLESKWTLWLRPPAKGRNKWPDAVEVCAVDTVQDFWRLYNNVPDADKIHAEYSFFRDGIHPAWEDPRAAPGGIWKIKVEDISAAEPWLSCLCAAIGGQFPFPDEILGFVVQPKPKSKINVWTAHDLSPEFQERVLATGAHFRKLVHPRQKAQFQSHAAAKRGEKVPERELS